MKTFRSSTFRPWTLLCLVALLAGCDRYLVTFNDQTVSQPRKVITTVEVADPGLQACIEQTLVDKKIHALDELTTLVCTHAGIRNLEGIQVFTGLTTLNLGDNGLSSIAPLLFLGSLASVNLENNDNLDCNELAALTSHLPADGILLAPAHCH